MVANARPVVEPKQMRPHLQSELPKPSNTTAAPGMVPILLAHSCSHRTRQRYKRIRGEYIVACNQRASEATRPSGRDG